MTFNSAEYLLFLPIVLAVYWLLPRRPQNLFLVAASYVFYGWWDERFLGLLVFSTGLDYFVGLRMEAASSDGARRRWLVGAITINLGILFFYKYWGFFTDSAEEALQALGLGGSAPAIRVALPVGISFYTFQSMSYAIDVYRRRLPACRDLLTYATFVSFFPQLVAGPIERAAHMLPQYEHDRTRPDADQAWAGVALILGGLVRKVVIADTLAPLVSTGYATGASGGAAATAVLAFSLQIYGDFAGYSSIARGSARLLGIDLMVNFDTPYASRNPAEFWRRWHISLSSWLRDYVYVPLGGNRRGAPRMMVNLVVVMLVGGLWHGPSWTFVAWGGLHGLLLVAHRLWTDRFPTARASTVLPRVALTFTAVSLLWVFFRAASFTQAADVLRAATTHPFQGLVAADVALLLAGGLATAGLDLIVRRWGDEAGIVHLAPVRQGALAGLMVLAVVVFAGAPPVPFIYFQF
jgi:alginate O-acetyltransferase complex protein AlgI